jgi:hypothetical protein
MTENLGKVGKDKITGFTGIITGYIQYLTGCNQYGIVPQTLDNNKPIPSEWFDVKRIEIVGEGVAVEDVADTTNPGGPNRDCPRN